MTEPVAAIVVAAGSGRRLGDSAAGGTGVKALRTLRGRALVRWSVEALRAGGAGEIVVVIPAGTDTEFAHVLADVESVTLVTGGAERQDSVRRGLDAVRSRTGVVLIHDAARPLVPPHVTAAVIAAVQAGARAVVPVVPVTDSVRLLDADTSRVLDRATLRAVQTPQGFDLPTIRAAHAAVGSASHTDDASVCEAYGVAVSLVGGSPRSLKITNPADFAAAAALLEEA